jgi:cysteine-rich repeat protein
MRASHEACGNGVIDSDEQCDDGNNVDGDGCSAKCGAPECFVPVTHSTIEAALMDANCSSIAVYSGIYAENLTIASDVSLRGVGAAPVIIDGQATSSVVTIASGTVILENVSVRTIAAGSPT